jgi:hypothetical protein
MFAESARYIEFSQQRAVGLGSFIAERNSAEANAALKRLRNLINKGQRQLVRRFKDLYGLCSQVNHGSYALPSESRTVC